MTDLQRLEEKMDFQWRVQSFSKNSSTASCVAYIDARDVQRRFDEVVGKQAWKNEYRMINDVLFCGIGVYCEIAKDIYDWVWKWDCGNEGKTEEFKDKSAASDAFKRAAIHWGVGRFLYDIPIEFIDSNAPNNGSSNYLYPVDKAGKRIFDLTKHIQNRK